MADVQDIKAGDYELVADHWDELTSEPDAKFATYERHVKGDIVTLSEEDAKRLVGSGAAIEPGAREKALALQLQAQLATLLAQMPDAIRSQVDPAKLAEQADEEVPVEERRVGDPGSELQNEGERPRVASASSGEGDGEVQEPPVTGGQTPVVQEPDKPAQAAKRSGRS